MAEIDVRFYHLTRSNLEQALPLMLEKTLERGKKATLILRDQERLKSISKLLWVYRDKAFLPHGSTDDGHPEHQPIWLSLESQNLNQSLYYFYTDGCFPEAPSEIEGLEVCAILFNGHDQAMVNQARICWKTLKEAGLRLTYWQQSERGWQQKASTHDDSDKADKN